MTPDEKKTPAVPREAAPNIFPGANRAPGGGGSLALWVWLGGGLTTLLLVIGLGLWMVENPSSAVYRAFVRIADLSIPGEARETDEFLVFLSEDSKANREALYRASPSVTYVADSILPGVVVVKIPTQLEQTMATLRGYEFVNLVMKYNPSFGCH